MKTTFTNIKFVFGILLRLDRRSLGLEEDYLSGTMEEDSSLGIVVVGVGKDTGGKDGGQLFISVDSLFVVGS